MQKRSLMMAAFLLALPVVLYQVWAFVAPGLYTHEKKLVMPLVISSTLLFFLGIGFCYFFVFGKVFTFIQSFAPKSVSAMPDIEAYLSFVLTMFIAFGSAFEVPIVVVVLRLLQGMMVGGEWTSAAAYIGESAPADKRGLYASIVTATAGLAFLVGTLTAVLLTASMDTESLAAWGWRVPFIASFAMAVVAVYIRRKLEDTPVYEEVERKRKAKGRRIIEDKDDGEAKGSNVIDLMAALRKSMGDKPSAKGAPAKKAPTKKAPPKKAAARRPAAKKRA